MSKEIWLGPVLGTNRERLLARCAEFVSKGEAHKFLYLAASHPLLELVTERLLDGAEARGVWGEFPVYLFRGFVRRVLAGAVTQEPAQPILPRISIDHEELPLKRSLISQLLNGLAATGKLKALAPLVHRDGCVNSIATLIGEIERAGKTPSEFAAIVEARAKDFDEEAAVGADSLPNRPTPVGLPDRGPRGRAAAVEPSLFSLLAEAVAPKKSSGPRPQIDFDRDVALVYSAYNDALERFALTDEDADQLRALEILRGEMAGLSVRVPWLEQVELLVLDGFFDFTPVQGEMMRCLIPSIPQVIVNLNGDQQNEEIFGPFRTTIDQLCSIAPFEVKHDAERLPASGALSFLRERLFNSETFAPDIKEAGACPLPDCKGAEESVVNSLEKSSTGSKKTLQKEITLFECSDRETEVRAIAKEIKRLVLTEGYKLADIALVVRERASYADTILRVLSDEAIPCNVERRTESIEVPAVRAALKLFQMLGSDAASHLKSTDLADLVKSDYFRLSVEDLAALQKDFELEYSGLLLAEFADVDSDQKSIRAERMRRELGIGRWDADGLENVIAFVGSELRVADWLARARGLIAELPAAEETRALLVGSESADEEDGDSVLEAESERDDPSIVRAPRPEKKRRPSREVHPAAIAWASIVIRRLDQLIRGLPERGQPLELRAALIKLLDARRTCASRS